MTGEGCAAWAARAGLLCSLVVMPLGEVDFRL